MLGQIVRSAAREPSFREAPEALADRAEGTISDRQLGRIAHEVGQQWQADREEPLRRYQAHPLEPRVTTPPALAVVEVDGGRLPIRGSGEGPGAHAASRRDDQVAVLATRATVTSDCDPEPELPDCLRDRESVETVLGALSGVRASGPQGPQAGDPSDLPLRPSGQPADPRKRPELAVRTYVATPRPVEQLGPMVAAEARRRHFLGAARRAFLGDGSAWIWGLQASQFPTFVALVEFLQALGQVFAAAEAAAIATEGAWELFQAWAEACGKGRAGQVIEERRILREVQASLAGGEADRSADEEPR